MLLCSVSLASSAVAADARPAGGKPAPIDVASVNHAGPVDFEKEILPLLSSNCLACHNKTKAKASLVLETPADIRKGGENGPAVTPGKAAESLLLKAASHAAGVDSPMPPAGNKVAAADLTPQQLGLLRLWIDQGATGEVRGSQAPVVWRALPASMGPTYAVAVSPDGRFAACGRGNRIDVYDLPAHALAATLADLALASVGNPSATHRDLVESLAFSPDSSTLASGSYREVKFWRRPQPAPAFTLGTAPVRCIAISPDRTLIATVSADDVDAGTVHLWDAATGKPTGELEGSGGVIAAMRFSPDGARLLTGSSNNTVRLWDVAAHKPFALGELPAAVTAVMWTVEAKQVAAGGADGVIRVLNVPGAPGGAMDTAKELKGHDGPVTALEPIPADYHILSGGRDGTIRRWSLKSGSSSRQMRTGAPVLSLAVSRDGKCVASSRSAAGNDGKLWSVDDGSNLGIKGDHELLDRAATVERVASLAGDAHGRLVAAGPLAPGRVLACMTSAPPVAWDLSGGAWTLQRTIGGAADAASPLSDRVTSLDFNGDGTLLAAAGGVPTRGGEVRLFEVPSGRLSRSFDDVHSDAVTCVRFSPDGTRLATASPDRAIKVLDAVSGKVLRTLEGHTGHALAVAWRRDGHGLASGGADNAIRFWNPDTGERGKVVQGFDKEVTGLAYLGTGDAVVACSGDGKVRVVRENGSDVRSLLSSPEFVNAVAATPSGGVVVAGSQDGTLRAWDGNSGAAAGTFPAETRDHR